MVKLGYTILYVTNVEQSIAFYENSFGFERKFITPNQDYAELSTGATTLSFASLELAQSNLKDGFLQSNLANKPFGIEIGLVTQNVEASMEKAIDHGAVLVEQAKIKPWGQTVGYIRDIDGFLLEICTPMS